MSTEEAILCYDKISGAVFGAKHRKRLFKGSKYKATIMEKEMKKIITDAGFSEDEHLLDTSVRINQKGHSYVSYPLHPQSDILYSL